MPEVCHFHLKQSQHVLLQDSFPLLLRQVISFSCRLAAKMLIKHPDNSGIINSHEIMLHKCFSRGADVSNVLGNVVVFQLSHENVYEVLCVADMYLLPGLKRLCGRTLAALLNEENVLHVWKTAKLFRLSRLEDQCTEYMAKIIERVCHGQRPCVHSQLCCVYVSQNSHYLHSS